MTATTTMTTVLFNESRKRGLLLLCIFIFPLIFTSTLFVLVLVIGDIDFKVVGSESKYAKIETPENRSVVNKKFTISGVIDTPLSNHSYYLMEYRNKLYWPKFDLGNTATHWTKKLTHRSKKQQYASYQIVMADAELKKTIEDWFKTSRESGKYPGIPNLSVDKIVANIRVKTL